MKPSKFCRQFAKVLLIGLLVGLFAVFVSAEEPTQQFNKFFLDPMYVESMDQDENYTYTVEVNPPEGFDGVVTAIVTFQVWHNPSVRYWLWVDGQACNTESFYVSTTYANAGEGTIYFDCSNVINKAGEYTITLQPDDDLGSSTAWLDMTYTTRAGVDMTFGATDYFTFEDRQLLFVQLIEGGLGEPIDDAICFAEVYNENADAHLIEDAPMIFLEDGFYHLHVNIVEPGVHIVGVKCFYEFNNTIHLVNETNTIGGNYELLPTVVDYEFWVTEDGGGSWVNETADVKTLDGTFVEVRHDWTNKFAIINNTGTIQNGAEINMYARNINKLGDTIYLHDITGTTIYASYFIDNVATFEWNNVTIANAGGGINMIYISDLGQGGAHDIRWDFIEVVAGTGLPTGDPDVNNSLSSIQAEDQVYWQIVENTSDELEVEFTFEDVTGMLNDSASVLWTGHWSGTESARISIWNVNLAQWDNLSNLITTTAPDIDVTNSVNNISAYIDGTAVKVRIKHTEIDAQIGEMFIDFLRLETYSASGDFVANVKGGGEIHIINMSTMSENVWGYPDRQLTAFNFDVTDEEEIWNYANRTLTESVALTNVTIADIGDQVWNNPDRNLTYYQSFENFSAANVWSYENRSLTTFGTLIADIWAYVTRTLTSFTFDVVDEELIADNVWNDTGRYTHGIVLS